MKAKCNYYTNCVFQYFFLQAHFLKRNKFHRRLLSIRVFSSDGHCRQMVFLPMNNIASHDQFKPIRIGDNFLVISVNQEIMSTKQLFITILYLNKEKLSKAGCSFNVNESEKRNMSERIE